VKRNRLFLLVSGLLALVFATSGLAQEPVTITYWTDPALATPVHHPEFDSLAEYEKWQAEQFMEMYPHVTVEVQGLQWAELSTKVPASIAAGNPPDILKDYLGRTSGYGHQEVTVDLFEHVPQEEIDDLLPGLVGLYTINGSLHAMPTYFWEHHMIVNKALFDQAGLGDLVPVDDHDWTQAEFLDAITQLRDAGIGVDYPFALQVASEQGDYDFHAFVWGAGGDIWRSGCNPAFDDPKTLAGVEFANRLYQEGFINPDAPTTSNDDKNNLFFTGKSAIIGGSMGTLNVIIPQAVKDGLVTVEMDPVLVTYPHAEGEVNGFPAGPTGFVVFDKGRSDYEMEWVTNFLLFLNSTEAQIDYVKGNSQFPARSSAGAPLTDDPNYQLVVDLIAERGTEDMGLSCAGFYEVRVAQPPRWQSIFLGQESPAEALESLTEEAADIISNQ
jgi:ABC-type glycerol-3-phosphate transport system substrate-binding protein